MEDKGSALYSPRSDSALIYTAKNTKIMLWLFLVLPFASLTFAANWQHEIFVNSSFGVNTTSCWNGGDQKHCATLNLALQGIQSNSTVIYLYPGIYILDNTSKVIDKSNIAIVGLTTKDGGKTVTIKCSSHSGLLFLSSTNITLESLVLHSCGNIQINPNRDPEFDFQVSAVYISMCYNVQLFDIVIDSGKYGSRFGTETSKCPYLIASAKSRLGEQHININATVIDCSDITYVWKNDIIVCIISGLVIFKNKKMCTSVSFSENQNFTVELNSKLNDTITNSSNITLSVEAQVPIVQTLQTNISITLAPALTCTWPFVVDKMNCQFIYKDWFCCSRYQTNNNNCHCNVHSDYIRLKSSDRCITYSIRQSYIGGYCPVGYNNYPLFYSNNFSSFSMLSFCAEGRTGRLCGACASDYGVPINQLNRCVKCDQHLLVGQILFFLIQLLPVTIMVFIIIVFNIQLTNGFMIGVVFYCQMISIVYPGLTLMVASHAHNNFYLMLPSSVFNINFLAFLFNYPLCMTPHMTPLQAISFWFIIPTYPLVLILLIYTWIIMYDKGFRCVVTITRPLHRLLARFWRMINIEPCLIHSTASIYLLCFTQFAATSLQLLHPTKWSVWNNANDNGIAFFYDGTLDYFGWPHSFAGIFAIIVLVFIIFLPMLYIQLYPLKLFHKLLSYLHLRKEMLISLCDMFTGPYKNGSNNTRDYRYFAGFYLFLRIIVLCLHYIPYENDGRIIILSQVTLFSLFAGMIAVFRPYKKNIHNFFDLVIFMFLVSMNSLNLIKESSLSYEIILLFSSVFIFGIILSAHYFYWIIKGSENCYQYCEVNRRYNSPHNEEHQDIEPLLVSDEDWIADRMENPDNYDEHHVEYVTYDLPVAQTQTTTEDNVHDNPNIIGTKTCSEGSTIPLHPIASATNESTNSTEAYDEDEV